METATVNIHSAIVVIVTVPDSARPYVYANGTFPCCGYYPYLPDSRFVGDLIRTGTLSSSPDRSRPKLDERQRETTRRGKEHAKSEECWHLYRRRRAVVTRLCSLLWSLSRRHHGSHRVTAQFWIFENLHEIVGFQNELLIHLVNFQKLRMHFKKGNRNPCSKLNL